MLWTYFLYELGSLFLKEISDLSERGVCDRPAKTPQWFGRKTKVMGQKNKNILFKKKQQLNLCEKKKKSVNILEKQHDMAREPL